MSVSTISVEKSASSMHLVARAADVGADADELAHLGRLADDRAGDRREHAHVLQVHAQRRDLGLRRFDLGLGRARGLLERRGARLEIVGVGRRRDALLRPSCAGACACCSVSARFARAVATRASAAAARIRADWIAASRSACSSSSSSWPALTLIAFAHVHARDAARQPSARPATPPAARRIPTRSARPRPARASAASTSVSRDLGLHHGRAAGTARRTHKRRRPQRRRRPTRSAPAARRASRASRAERSIFNDARSLES